LSSRIVSTPLNRLTQADGAVSAPATPTVTHYQQLADALMKDLDALGTVVPDLEVSHIATAPFVRSHLNVPLVFLATAIHTVEQTPELQLLNKLDPVAARDALQFIEAFRPVLDKVTAFQQSLEFTVNSKRSLLTADALQIYAIAKGLARDPSGAVVGMHVLNLKRDLNRKGPRKEVKAAGSTAPQPQAT